MPSIAQYSTCGAPREVGDDDALIGDASGGSALLRLLDGGVEPGARRGDDQLSIGGMDRSIRIPVEDDCAHAHLGRQDRLDACAVAHRRECRCDISRGAVGQS